MSKSENRSAGHVRQQAGVDNIERQNRIRTLVSSLDGEAERGEFISDEAMTAWFLALGTKDERPEPKPDVILKSK